ncbi:MAG: hypothetical protein QG671_1945 [Actinomycetota bacterium]|nr:hypothetical protein [Actinomycetota bacterium]
MSIDIAAARHCAQLAASLYRGRELPDRLRRHIAELGSEVGTGSAAAQPHSKHDDLIGVATAASILGVSQRYVRRIAADLDGTRIDGRTWVFDRQVVAAYASARTVGRQRDCA